MLAAEAQLMCTCWVALLCVCLGEWVAACVAELVPSTSGVAAIAAAVATVSHVLTRFLT
jgi:hypothetical protein